MGLKTLTMLGIKDPWIIAAYLLSVGSAILCVVYGLLNWNKGNENEASEISEEANWEKEERIIDESL